MKKFFIKNYFSNKYYSVDIKYSGFIYKSDEAIAIQTFTYHYCTFQKVEIKNQS